MEQQFILRLPERLQGMDTRDFKLARVGRKEVMLFVKDKSYPGIICKLPTIVESQKYIDNKLYKIANVSTLVVIYENSDFSLEDEIRKHECSGLTPPMAYAKERRFNKTTIRTEEVEKIERKVAELLREDSNAIKVEVVTNEKDSSDIDLEMFAAEIENDVSASREARVPSGLQSRSVSPVVEVSNSRSPIDSHSSRLGDHPQHQSKLGQNHERPGFDRTTNILQPTEASDIPEASSRTAPPNRMHPQDSTAAQNARSPQASQIHHAPDNEETSQIESRHHPELLELEAKIKEKQEMFDRAVNPILKKRFEQSLGELKAEYEKRKRELA